jgi:hypothetical protein
MSRSRRSLIDDMLDRKEEEFICSPGKRKSASFRCIMMTGGDAENNDDDDDDVKESLHTSLGPPLRSTKVQRTFLSMLSSSDGKRSSASTPYKVLATPSGIQEESCAAAARAQSFDDDGTSNDHRGDVIPPFLLSSQSLSTVGSGGSSMSTLPAELVVGLPKLRRSIAIRDPVDLAISIENFRDSLREQGEEPFYG